MSANGKDHGSPVKDHGQDRSDAQLREYLDLVDQAVAAITDDDVETRLQRLLGRRAAGDQLPLRKRTRPASRDLPDSAVRQDQARGPADQAHLFPRLLSDLASSLGVPVTPGSLDRALTHRSYAYENANPPTNERLEFLGDSVLGLVVTDTLYRGYPNLPEGQLAKLRAAVVQMGALAGVARGLDLGAYIRLGRGEQVTGGRDKSSILADTLEAVIGAVYIDCGLSEASALVHRLFDPVIARSASLGAGLDWKTSLQELTAGEMLGVPDYQVEESGPDHAKSFHAVVRVGGRVLGSGAGKSKKAAEQQAAEAAWRAITAETAGEAVTEGTARTAAERGSSAMTTRALPHGQYGTAGQQDGQPA
jgi:ribonuclease III